MSLIHKIQFNNYEGIDCEVNIEDADINAAFISLQGGENPAILESVDSDDDKTKSIKGRRLLIEFNSQTYTDAPNVENFSDGDDNRFAVTLDMDVIAGVPTAVPFAGHLVIDDNSEPFQPRPNLVQLSAGEGLGSLRDVELKTTLGELPLGKYSIMDYIVMCLNNLYPNQEIHVVMNLYEVSTNPVTSHAFVDTFLDALTFEKDIDEREDCFTVLEKILDAFGCFITYDNDGWWIIRWDEYDAIGMTITTLRTANFDSTGAFINYTNTDLTKKIAHDGDVNYEGYRLSLDTAVRRFQRRAKEIRHFYKFETPKEIPCNSSFTKGDIIDDTDPLEKTYVLDSWTTHYDISLETTSPVDGYITVTYDSLDYEKERYAVVPKYSTENSFIKSCPIEIGKGDRFNISFNWAFSVDWVTGGAKTIYLCGIKLVGDDASLWMMDTNGKWYEFPPQSVYLYLTDTIQDPLIEDERDFRNVSVDSEPIPVDGKMYIHLHNWINTIIPGQDPDVYYSEVRLDYKPFINNSYAPVSRQEHRITASDDTRKKIEKEMFISDSPRKLFKGAMFKFDSPDYVLTDTWIDYIVPPGDALGYTRLAKWVIFAWWNQFRKTRTVIESDFQGINSGDADGMPGLIHRWKIYHDSQDDKYFMLTSYRVDCRTCGWYGVLVETSDADGDRNYFVVGETYSFKYIQE